MLNKIGFVNVNSVFNSNDYWFRILSSNYMEGFFKSLIFILFLFFHWLEFFSRFFNLFTLVKRCDCFSVYWYRLHHLFYDFHRPLFFRFGLIFWFFIWLLFWWELLSTLFLPSSFRWCLFSILSLLFKKALLYFWLRLSLHIKSPCNKTSKPSCQQTTNNNQSNGPSR